MKIAEKIILVFVFIGLTLKILHLPGAGIILVLTLTSLSMLYMIGGFYFFSQHSDSPNKALSILSGFVGSVFIIGFLFKLMFWPGSGFLLLNSSAILIPMFGYALYKMSMHNAQSVYYRNLAIRFGIYLSIAVFFFTLPKYEFYKMTHNDPKQVELFIRASESEKEEDWDDFYDYINGKSIEGKNEKNNEE